MPHHDQCGWLLCCCCSSLVHITSVVVGAIWLVCCCINLIRASLISRASFLAVANWVVVAQRRESLWAPAAGCSLTGRVSNGVVQSCNNALAKAPTPSNPLLFCIPTHTLNTHPPTHYNPEFCKISPRSSNARTAWTSSLPAHKACQPHTCFF